MKKMRVTGIVALVIVAVVIMVLSLTAPTSTVIEGSSSLPDGSSSLFDISAADLIYFGVVVLGIIAKQMIDSWFSTRQIKIEVGYAVIAILLAALVYSGISSQIPEAPVTLASLCLVFQYGVGWQALVDVVGKQKTA
ncbi:MAG: hypothetical protein KF726_10855 [Anaerolineae bacterium]|nr:hypothetical protein [Anaerolineae bacterium]